MKSNFGQLISTILGKVHLWKVHAKIENKTSY